MTQLGTGAGQAVVKRFYEGVDIVPYNEGFALHLDGRPAKTRGRNLLSAQSKALADALATEWRAQEEIIDFRLMPLTRLQTTYLDHGKSDAPDWRATILSFLQSDLLCYRAETPAALQERQAAKWDPYLAWADRVHGLTFRLAQGVIAVEQPTETIAAGSRALEKMTVPQVLGVRVATEATGSSILGMAAASGVFTVDDLFDASRVDEAFQIERWGEDDEASSRAERVRQDLDSAVRYLAFYSV